MKFLRSCFVFILAVVLLAIAGTAYALAGPPRDLGVRHTEADLQSSLDKLNQQIVPSEEGVPAGISVASPVDTTLSQEECSAHVEKVHPLGSVQIRYEGDQFEMSGRILRARIPGFLRGLGFDVNDAEVLDFVNDYFPIDPTFYFSGSGNVNNGQVTFNLQEAQLGRLPFPVEQAEEFLVDYNEWLVDEVSAYNLDSVAIEDGQLGVQGTAASQLPDY